MNNGKQAGAARRWATRAGVALALSAAAAVSAAQSTTPVKHARGETAVPANPSKTIVLDLAVLDTLHTLGVDPIGVPSAAKLPPQLSQFADKRYLKAGTMFEPNYEVIHAAAPQVIFVAGRSAPKYDELSKIAPTVDLTVDAKDLVGSV
ncbi:iron ABC transporter substrate-binding protein, partial [Achromobacter sp. ACRQX]|nr:iron ABC transporter substrate-binding protein [Achromobacter sp. ACRQX]